MSCAPPPSDQERSPSKTCTIPPQDVKELRLRFVFGYTGEEFAAVLQRGAPDGLITSTLGLDGVAAAFEALHKPGEHVTTMVKP